MVFQKPNKSAVILTVSKEETRENLRLLHDDFVATETCMLRLVNRLQWFRDFQGYKHFGYSTFQQFVKHECGKTRQWIWERFKALPVQEQERELVSGRKPGLHDDGKPACKPGLPEGEENRDCDPENRASVKLEKMPELSHKQRLEVSKLSPLDRKRVIEVLLEKHPGADIDTTREVIDETLGRSKPEPKKRTDPEMELAFGAESPSEKARGKLRAIGGQLIASAQADSDAQLRNVVATLLQQIKWAMKGVPRD